MGRACRTTPAGRARRRDRRAGRCGGRAGEEKLEGAQEGLGDRDEGGRVRGTRREGGQAKRAGVFEVARTGGRAALQEPGRRLEAAAAHHLGEEKSVAMKEEVARERTREMGVRRSYYW